MTPQDILHQMRALKLEAGPNACVFTSIDADAPNGLPVYLSLYADGMMKDVTFIVRASEWSDLMDKAFAKWAEIKDRFRADTIRKMALEIIRLTADQGECTDAALRMAFSAEEIAKFGREATEDANKIAANGPFAITSGARENAA